MEAVRQPTQLYLVPTPIGNLEDITLRAIRVLKEVNTILAEDTRQTGILLKHFDIQTPMQSYHIFNEHKTLPALIRRLEEGEVIALVSDAGTPAISDPGFLIVREALAHQIAVECLPGATAFVPALVKSGFPTDRFVFEGFLPHKKGKQTRVKQLSEEARTVVMYESPHRLLKTLKMFAEFVGTARQVSVSRELTKLYEETQTGTLDEVIRYFEQQKIRGEFVIVLQGKTEP